MWTAEGGLSSQATPSAGVPRTEHHRVAAIGRILSSIVNTRHGIENIQNQSKTFVVFGLYALQGAAFEERLEPLMPETLDHPDSPFIVRTTEQAKPIRLHSARGLLNIDLWRRGGVGTGGVGTDPQRGSFVARALAG